MGRKLVDITGQRFNSLVALEYLGRRHHSSVWKCRCDCGNETEVASSALKNATIKSCGCFRKQRMEGLNYKHGKASHVRPRGAVYKIWDGIKDRCRNPNSPVWKWYGGKGIDIYEPWANNYELFEADVGQRPSKKHSLDRIDGSKGYVPGNVRWATSGEQARNRSNNRLTEVDGKMIPLVAACEIHGMPYKTVKNRITNGWDVWCALVIPVNQAKANATRYHRKAKRAPA